MFGAAYADVPANNRMQTPAMNVRQDITHLNGWTGFYGGANMGYVFNDATLKAQHAGFSNLSGTCDTSSDYSSFFPGAQLGYSYQARNNIVVGVEGNITYNTNPTATLSCNCSHNAGVSDQFSFKNHMQGSIIGRLGYALEGRARNILPFIAAGVSVADVSLNYRNESGDYYNNQNRNPTGWLLGAGVEWNFLRNWSLRAQYEYVDYGRAIQLNIPTIYTLLDPNGSGHVNLNTNTVLVALNYWVQ